jgi:pimeloyl-ACP methyl ester carboxylesterase
MKPVRTTPEAPQGGQRRLCAVPTDRANSDAEGLWWARHRPAHSRAPMSLPTLRFLKDITVPVQLWRAGEDHILPNPDYAKAVRIALPSPLEFHLVENGDHFDFLAPCTDILRQVAPVICVSRPRFDRVGFHQTFNDEVVRFFGRTLG